MKQAAATAGQWQWARHQHPSATAVARCCCMPRLSTIGETTLTENVTDLKPQHAMLHVSSHTMQQSAAALSQWQLHSRSPTDACDTQQTT
jgi:hypothetical protein